MSAIIFKDTDKQAMSQIDTSIFSQGPVVVFRWGDERPWPVDFVTPNVSGVFGYPSEEFINGALHYEDIVHPDDLSRVAAEVQRYSFSGCEQYQHEHYRIVTKDKDVRWVEHYTHIVRNTENKVLHYLGYVLDITERKTAELDMRAMLNAVPDLMFKVNQNGTFLDYHARRASDLAMPPEAFLGKRIQDVFPASIAQEGMKCLEKVLRTGDISTHEYAIPTLKGSVCDFEARYVAKGNNEALIVIRDVTQRNLAQDALRKREAQLNLIADQVRAIFWAVDKGLRFTMSHGAGLNTLGLLPNEVVGMSVFDFFRTNDPEYPPIANVIRALNGQSVSFDLVWSRVVYQSFVEPLHDERGEVVGAVGISLDITDRRMSEQRLTQSEARFKDIAESMSDWIWETDANGVYTYCSERIEDILGYRPEEIIGRKPFDLMPGDEAEKIVVEFAEIYANKSPVKNLENWNLAKDGRRVCLLTNGIPLLDDAGNLIGYRGVDTDITERKLTMEALIEAKEEAEVASQAKSQFLSRMSHELRTPLNAILGYSELMMEAGEDPITENQRGTLNTIHEAGHHLLSLINEVLDLARIEAGKMEVALKGVDWREVINQCFELTNPAANNKAVYLKIESPEMVAPLVYADQQRFKQVLLNLISNAVKYNRQGGEAVVRILEDRQNKLRFEIHDTGNGLTKDQIEQLFQPFNRLAPDDGLLEGVGIGLVISKHLVELMGGSIGVHSVPGEGSVFWVILPAAKS